MSDLEITRLCAEAMNIRGGWRMLPDLQPWDSDTETDYDPLHDDAQAMALVKKFQIDLFVDDSSNWNATIRERKSQRLIAAYRREPNLNRAICECVAKMHAAKVPA